MKKLTLKDVRSALYDMMIPAVRNVGEEDLASADFWFDLGMDEQKVQLLITNLERTHRIMLTTEVSESLEMKNTVATLLHAANSHLIDLEEN